MQRKEMNEGQQLQGELAVTVYCDVDKRMQCTNGQANWRHEPIKPRSLSMQTLRS